ncbi:MAG TPA: right-handed parallel beta-helix repeat-containing protein, partial [Candidatus Thermoplasmatota archaeon]|nr:right-handed parallel beta-helix repeat-containing protein [Candidatus Thermoplasmatota archaeon]
HRPTTGVTIAGGHVAGKRGVDMGHCDHYCSWYGWPASHSNRYEGVNATGSESGFRMHYTHSNVLERTDVWTTGIGYDTPGVDFLANETNRVNGHPVFVLADEGHVLLDNATVGFLAAARAHNLTLTGITLGPGAGSLMLDRVDNVSVSGLRRLDASPAQGVVKGSRSVLLADADLAGTRLAVHDSVGTTLRDVVLSSPEGDSTWVLDLWRSPDARLDGLDVNATWDAVQVRESPRVTVADSRIRHHSFGIAIATSDNATLLRNVLSDATPGNGIGVDLSGSRAAVLQGNRIDGTQTPVRIHELAYYCTDGWWCEHYRQYVFHDIAPSNLADGGAIHIRIEAANQTFTGDVGQLLLIGARNVTFESAALLGGGEVRASSHVRILNGTTGSTAGRLLRVDRTDNFTMTALPGAAPIGSRIELSSSPDATLAGVQVQCPNAWSDTAVMLYASPRARVENVSVDGCYYGLRAYDADDLRLHGGRYVNSTYGLMFDYADRLAVRDASVRATYRGVHMGHQNPDATLAGLDVSGGSLGVFAYVPGSERLTLAGSRIHNVTDRALWLDGPSATTTVRGNRIEDAPNGLDLRHGRGTRIEANAFSRVQNPLLINGGTTFADWELEHYGDHAIASNNTVDGRALLYVNREADRLVTGAIGWFLAYEPVNLTLRDATLPVASGTARIVRGRQVALHGVNVTGAGGALRFVGTADVTVANATFAGAQAVFENVDGLRVADSAFRPLAGGTGALVLGGTRTAFDRAAFEGGATGLCVQQRSWGLCGGAGVSGALVLHVNDSTFRDQSVGMRLDSVASPSLASNAFTGVATGVSTWRTSTPTLVGNAIMGGALYAPDEASSAASPDLWPYVGATGAGNTRDGHAVVFAGGAASLDVAGPVGELWAVGASWLNVTDLRGPALVAGASNVLLDGGAGAGATVRVHGSRDVTLQGLDGFALDAGNVERLVVAGGRYASSDSALRVVGGTDVTLDGVATTAGRALYAHTTTNLHVRGLLAENSTGLWLFSANGCRVEDATLATLPGYAPVWVYGSRECAFDRLRVNATAAPLLYYSERTAWRDGVFAGNDGAPLAVYPDAEASEYLNHSFPGTTFNGLPISYAYQQAAPTLAPGAVAYWVVGGTDAVIGPEELGPAVRQVVLVGGSGHVLTGLTGGGGLHQFQVGGVSNGRLEASNLSARVTLNGVQDFVVEGSAVSVHHGPALQVYGGRGVHVRNSTLEAADGPGLSAFYVQDLTVENGTVAAASVGLDLYSPYSGKVAHVAVEGAETGLRLRTWSPFRVHAVTVDGAERGFDLGQYEDGSVSGDVAFTGASAVNGAPFAYARNADLNVTGAFGQVLHVGGGHLRLANATGAGPAADVHVFDAASVELRDVALDGGAVSLTRTPRPVLRNVTAAGGEGILLDEVWDADVDGLRLSGGAGLVFDRDARWWGSWDDWRFAHVVRNATLDGRPMLFVRHAGDVAADGLAAAWVVGARNVTLTNLSSTGGRVFVVNATSLTVEDARLDGTAGTALWATQVGPVTLRRVHVANNTRYTGEGEWRWHDLAYVETRNEDAVVVEDSSFVGGIGTGLSLGGDQEGVRIVGSLFADNLGYGLDGVENEDVPGEVARNRFLRNGEAGAYLEGEFLSIHNNTFEQNALGEYGWVGVEFSLYPGAFVDNLVRDNGKGEWSYWDERYNAYVDYVWRGVVARNRFEYTDAEGANTYNVYVDWMEESSFHHNDVWNGTRETLLLESAERVSYWQNDLRPAPGVRPFNVTGTQDYAPSH